VVQSLSWLSTFQRSDPTLDAALQDLAFGAVEYDRDRTLAAAAVIEERVGAGGLLDARRVVTFFAVMTRVVDGTGHRQAGAPAAAFRVVQFVSRLGATRLAALAFTGLAVIAASLFLRT
jgi:hypothetical protein